MVLSSRRRRAGIAAGIFGAIAAAALMAPFVGAPAPGPLLSRRSDAALEVTDRNGEPLRLLPDSDGTRFRPVRLGQVSPHLVRAVLAAEDRRFFSHAGADPVALARATWQNLVAMRIVSGASTLSMQLARILDPHPRGLAAKARQVLLALRLEAGLGKKGVLAEYLSRAPMGNRVVGFEAASRVYLDKPAQQLSPAEAALLACIPRSPSRANPWRRGDLLRERRDEVLRRMKRLGFLDDVSFDAALAEPVVLAENPFRLEAPHFLARVREECGPARDEERRIVGSLDLVLQRRVEALARRHLAEMRPNGVRHMAVVVLDVRRGEWLAIEGSGRSWDEAGGAIDGTRAPRQPGSALKPFTYALAFDRGMSPATVLPDLPRSFPWATGTWSPRNYDDRYHGPIRARQALACSVNVPAAVVLGAVGPESLLATLRTAGITTLGGDAAGYGLGLTLGAGEVRLDELTNAYAALVREGAWMPARSWRAVLDGDERVRRRPESGEPVRIVSPQAAAQVVDVLSDPDARAPAFGLWSVLRLPFAAMVKTGTSEGFRDNWCVGGTREVMVGVWCGNFDRSPMGNVSGVRGAGALWREVMLAWAELRHRGEDLSNRATLGPSPGELIRVPVCALSGMAPTRVCPLTVQELLRRSEPPLRLCDWHALGSDGRAAVAWPSLYRDWAAREGLLADAASSAPAAVSSSGFERRGRRGRGTGPAVEIVSPADGDSYLLVPDLPRRYQTIDLRCSVRGSPREIAWLVDGKQVARAPMPYSASWGLEPGTHRIQAAAGSASSPPVTVTVLGQ